MAGRKQLTKGTARKGSGAEISAAEREKNVTEKIRNGLTLLLTGLALFGLTLAGFLRKPEAYSYSERRSLAQRPELSAEALLSGGYMTDFEAYVLDQFPLRDTFRSLKAFSSLYVFRQKDNDGVYVIDGNLSRLEYPLREDMIGLAGDRFQYIYDTYLAGTDCRIYLSVIPDKNAFLAPLGGYLSMDYPYLVENLRDRMEYASYIDIWPELSLDHYYLTDQHWRQETLLPVAETLIGAMDTGYGTEHGDIPDGGYVVHELGIPFYGAYYGQAALPVEADTLYYLTSDVLEDCRVTSYHTGQATVGSLYDRDRAGGRDPYEMFLMGANPLLVIENPHGDADRELVIFRDSFASSLAPLLVSAYGKITLVDLRYIRSSVLGQFVSFDGQDVLFLYSTLILNNSSSLK